MLRPRVIEVKPTENYELYLKFNNGEEKILDMKEKLNHIFFEPLKIKEIFNTVHTNGITVEWDQEIDLCPDELYYESVSVCQGNR